VSTTPRDNHVGIRFSDEEIAKLKERADKQHLKLASYCRWYLFHSGFVISKNTEVPIERISHGVPKRIDRVHTVKEMNAKKEVMREMKQAFEQGITLTKLDMSAVRKEIETNREKEPEKYLEELKVVKLENLKPPSK